MNSNRKASRLLSRAPIYNDVQRKISTNHGESGQVYTEVTCPAGPMTADWVWKTRGSTREAENYLSTGPGCSSLTNMTIRSALYNLFNLTAESLQGLPWELASLLWQRITAAQLDSVRVWQAFASTYPNELDEASKSKRHTILKPNMKLIDYIRPISSPSPNWITFLTLSHITCSRTDLMHISQLVNLGCLTIGPYVQTPEVGLEDSVIKNWGRLAFESDAFSMLRVLSCRMQRDITKRVFSQLNQFPALALFNVEACFLGPPEKTTALRYGWKYKTGAELSEWLVRGGAKGSGWDTITHACFRLGGPFRTDTLIVNGVQAIDDLPLLHLSLGAAPPDAVVDLRGERSLGCFHRTRPDASHQDESVPASQKRRLCGIPKGSLPRKKPTMRASKQQNMEDLLAGFGG